MDPAQIFLTEVINFNDPRSQKFSDRKLRKLQDLKKRNPWRVVRRSNVPIDANMLGVILVISVKDDGMERKNGRTGSLCKGTVIK